MWPRSNGTDFRQSIRPARLTYRVSWIMLIPLYYAILGSQN